MSDYPILRGERIKLSFATDAEHGFACGCCAHYGKTSNVVHVNVEHPAYGRLVMFMAEQRPRGLSEDAAIDIAADIVSGFLDQYLNDYFEHLPDIIGAFKQDVALPMAINEISLELAILAAIHSNTYDHAVDVAVDEMALDVAEKREARKAKKTKPESHKKDAA